MSTPKLKVYRLPQDYNSQSATDIQSITNDELVPVVKKDLDVFKMEECVPVAERRDARLVREGDWKTIIVPLDINPNNLSQVKTKPICCDGWVLGQGNIDISVFKIRNSAITNLSIGAGNPLQNYMFGRAQNFDTDNPLPNDNRIDTEFGMWSAPLDLKYWKYEVTSKKVMTDVSGNVVQLAADAVKYNLSDYIVFSIGEIIDRSTELPHLTGSANDGYLPLIGTADNAFTGWIMVRYKLYAELENDNWFANNASDGGVQSATSKYRAPFGDIYNGSRSGRDIRYSQNGDVSKEVVSHYEGNYTHKRRILPLRVLVGKSQSATDNQFATDVEYVGNTVSFNAGADWYLDGLLKPVVYEKTSIYEYNVTTVATHYTNLSYVDVQGAQSNRVIVIGDDDESRGAEIGWIYKQLDESLQIGVTFVPKTNNTPTDIYRVSFKDTFYTKATGVYLYPQQVLLAYNCHDDAMGPVGDFNYDYAQIGAMPKYGHENDGKFFAERGEFFNTGKIFYKKAEVLAVQTALGYNSETDWLLTPSTNSVSFTFPGTWRDATVSVGSGANHPGFRIYKGTQLIYNANDNTITSDYSISVSGRDVTVTRASAETELPLELLVVYYEEHQIAFVKDGSGNNPWCIGFRIPCYQKVKRSKRWVSSYPNWMAKHLNNDLDVFYGNTEYSGTDTAAVSNNGIYPCYLEFGTWSAFYNDGYVEFNEVKESIDYFDIFNFPSLISASIDLANYTIPQIPTCLPANSSAAAQKLALYYAKAKVNVAHYDGIFAAHRCRLSNYSCAGGQYWYAPLEDEDFADVVGKKWLTRNDEGLVVFYENKREQYPRVVSMNETVNTITPYQPQPQTLWRINTVSDRIVLMQYQIDISNRSDVVLLINPSIQSETEQVVGIQETDVRLHVNIDNATGHLKVGTEIVPVESSQVFGVGNENMNWTELEDFEDLYNIGVGIGEVHMQAPRFQYSNPNWYYDVFVELVSYKYSSYTSESKTVSSAEFAIYKVDKPR